MILILLSLNIKYQNAIGLQSVDRKLTQMSRYQNQLYEMFSKVNISIAKHW